MPSRQEIVDQLSTDAQIKQALNDESDDEKKPHTLEHHFLAEQAESLSELARVGQMLGFNVSEIWNETPDDGNRYFTMNLLSVATTQLQGLGRESLLMTALAEAFGVAYDGWGTHVEK
jgi:regulator of RNase E activity RraB